MKYFLVKVILLCSIVSLWAGNPTTFKITAKPSVTLRYSDNLTRAVAFHPNSLDMAVADARGYVDLINPTNGQRRLRIKAYDKKVIFAVTYSKDGNYIATGVWGKAPVKIFDTKSGHLLRVLTDEHYAISLDFSYDSKLLASSTENGTVKLFNVKTGKLVKLLHKKNVNLYYPYEVKFSPDSRQLACAIANKKKGVLIWNIKTGRLIKRIATKEDMMRLHYSNDGSLLAVGGGLGRKKRNYVYLYNTKSFKLKKIFKEHADYIYGVAFSPDDKALITTSWEVGIRARVWDIVSGKRTQLIRDRSGQSEAMAISPDGKYVAFRLRTLGNLGNPYTFKMYKTSLAGGISTIKDTGSVSDVNINITGDKGLVLMKATNGHWYPAISYPFIKNAPRELNTSEIETILIAAY